MKDVSHSEESVRDVYDGSRECEEVSESKSSSSSDQKRTVTEIRGKEGVVGEVTALATTQTTGDWVVA